MYTQAAREASLKSTNAGQVSPKSYTERLAGMLGPGPSRGGQPFSLPKMEDVVSGAWKDPSYPESVDLEAVASPEDADYPSLKAMNDEGHKLTAQQYQNFKTATKALKFSAYAMLTAEEAMQRGFRRPMHAELLPLLHLVQDGWTD